jgi:hypothetical protein
MGLDIYLYRYNDFKKTRELEEEYQEVSTKIWEDVGEYETLTDEQKKETREKCEKYAESLGLGKWGEDDNNKEKIEIDHESYPDHYFKIGYFRSSYNDSGIERILRNFDLPTLYDILGRDDSEEYEFQPNWGESLVRCEEVIESLKKKNNFRVSHVSGNMFSETTVNSEKEAMDIFLNEFEKDNRSFGDSGYSNKHGEFYPKTPLKVFGMIPGKYKVLGEMPCTYIIFEGDNEWYIQALEIVRDTIKYVLSKENQDQYYLHWSS